MFGWTRVRYEVQICGLWLLALPVGAVVALVVLAALLDAHGLNRGFSTQLLLGALEAGLPLTAGLMVAQVAGRDPAVELILSLPVAYRYVAGWRCGLLLGWTALVALAAGWAVGAFFPWALPTLAGTAALIWLAPMLWLAGAGALLTLALRSRIASGAVLGALWVTELAFHSSFAGTNWTQPAFLFATLEGIYALGLPAWWTNRLELGVGAGLLFLAAWWILRHGEWRLRMEES